MRLLVHLLVLALVLQGVPVAFGAHISGVVGSVSDLPNATNLQSPSSPLPGLRAWATADGDRAAGGISVDLLQARALASTVKRACTRESTAYVETLVNVAPRPGELYAEAVVGVPDTSTRVNAEEIKALKLNVWGVLGIGLGVVGVSLVTYFLAGGSGDKGDRTSYQAGGDINIQQGQNGRQNVNTDNPVNSYNPMMPPEAAPAEAPAAE